MYLIDTNVFLEILLSQERRETCKRFLDANTGSIYITDFSLHSIGVILFRNAKEGIFQKFAEDVISNIEVIGLQKELYNELTGIKRTLRLDFDDAYQYRVAKEYGLEIVTMDSDFEKARRKVKVKFL